MARQPTWEYPPEAPEIEPCPLCDRDMNREDRDNHHLIPRQKGGAKGPTVDIHRFCHTKVHSLLTNGELAKRYNTIDALKSHPDIQKFIDWVKDKPSGFYMKNTSTRDKGRRV